MLKFPAENPISLYCKGQAVVARDCSLYGKPRCVFYELYLEENTAPSSAD